MNISSIGSYSVQALNLFATSVSNGSGGGTDTSGSALDAGTDLLSISAQAQWASRSQSAHPFKTDFEHLGALISSGDLTGAKQAYAAMQEKMQAHPRGPGDSDPMASDFAAIGKALAAGDATSAQSAWNALETQLQGSQAD